MLTMLFLAMFAQLSDPTMVKCTSVGGPFPIGPTGAHVPLKCCPPGSYIDDPDHPVDANGNLICSRQTVKLRCRKIYPLACNMTAHT